MYSFADYILRQFLRATDWNPDAQYSHLTRASSAILDFPPPSSLSLSLSSSPTPSFHSSATLSLLPGLAGSIAYLTSSVGVLRSSSRDVALREFEERFGVGEEVVGRPPEGREVWDRGEKVFEKDYLLYGQLHLPTARLNALYARRLSPTTQLLLSSLTHPRPATRAHPSDVHITYQRDTGRSASEYAYSVADGMWSASALYHFDPVQGRRKGEGKRVDEEVASAGGLKGRFSVGGEVYVSALEKSAGLSTGLRFQTLPGSSSPPTVLAALLSPLTGHLSASYAARVAPDLALASRFDFNLYSYESETCFGGEWALRRRRQSISSTEEQNPVIGIFKARVSTHKQIALQYAGKLEHFLLALGVSADLSTAHRARVGLELQYFSSGSAADAPAVSPLGTEEEEGAVVVPP